MSGQYRKLVGYTSKYPYVVGISSESGHLGSGILISAKFVLTCAHVLHDSTSAEVISHVGTMSARVQTVDDSLDLALLELPRPISAPKVKFTDSLLQPGAVLVTVGVQETPGELHELSVAEIELKYRNKNDADGKILDIQLEGGARPGYSGGPVLADEGGACRCVGVMRFGGPGASSSNAVGIAAIQAFLADYIPHMPEEKLRTNADSRPRRLFLTAILLGLSVVVAMAKWFYVAPHSSKVTGNGPVVGTPGPEKTAPIDSHKMPSRTPLESTGARPILSSQTPVGLERVDQGSPNVMVWVNTASGVYHCPGTRSYGKTLHGEYVTQSEAQRKANRPARGKVCR
jgi:hypothetical protein